MNLAVLKDSDVAENRVALIPTHVEKLTKLGALVFVEKDLGKNLNLTDSHYEKAGAKVLDRKDLINQADIVVRIRRPNVDEVKDLKKGSIHISFLDPFNEKEILSKFREANVSGVSLEMIPRTTKAQKMDVLSSQASLAGYSAVILAQNHLPQIFPMMMTPAGTLGPSRVFIIGAGVAGLQAIATAKRLGARVNAFDTRPVVEEQVKSLGAKFVKLDLGETGQTSGGYANALTEEQLNKQRQLMKKHCQESDVVITTAQVFGRKAPVIVTKDMIEVMRPGSVVVDLAVETGGNVEGVELGKIVERHGVKLIGLPNLAGMVNVHASQMLSSNIFHLIEEFWNKEKKILEMNLDNEILKGCLITHQGQIVHPLFKS